MNGNVGYKIVDINSKTLKEDVESANGKAISGYDNNNSVGLAYIGSFTSERIGFVSSNDETLYAIINNSNWYSVEDSIAQIF